MVGYTYGALRDQRDKRDFLVKTHLKRIVETDQLPREIVYKYTGLVRHQKLPACVGYACATLKYFQEEKDMNEAILFSPFFIYNQRPNAGDGMYSRDAMNILLKQGCCPEWVFPEHYGDKRPVTDYHRSWAKNFMIDAYVRISDIYELKKMLVQYGPCYAAIPVYSTFISVKNGDVISLPQSDEKEIGGHAICIIGYSDDKQAFRVLNSWGTGWGEQGEAWLSYEYMARAWDMYALVDKKSIRNPWLVRLMLWLHRLNSFVSKHQLLVFFFLLMLISLIYAIFGSRQ